MFQTVGNKVIISENTGKWKAVSDWESNPVLQLKQDFEKW